MDMELHKLLDRQKRVMDNISKNPKTLAEVVLIFGEFVASLEEIANDLAITPDEQVAKEIREMRIRFFSELMRCVLN